MPGFFITYNLNALKNQKLKGASKNSDFFVSTTRKHRAENRNVYGIHEDLSTELTL
jgi:hypothetical protein